MIRITEFIARWISKVQINGVHEQMFDGQPFIVKQRSRFRWPLIALGNTLFLFRPTPVRVLGRKAWIQWEKRVQETVGRNVLQYDSTGLRIPKIPGRPLCETLLNNSATKPQVLEILSLGLAELYRFHQTKIELGGESVKLSHGDASVSNIIYDRATGSMSWFDFDLRHDYNRPAPLRHADDLRAFVYTAAKCLPPEMFGENGVQELADTIKDSYPSSEVWEAMNEITSAPGFTFDFFHQAQLWRL